MFSIYLRIVLSYVSVILYMHEMKSYLGGITSDSVKEDRKFVTKKANYSYFIFWHFDCSF